MHVHRNDRRDAANAGVASRENTRHQERNRPPRPPISAPAPRDRSAAAPHACFWSQVPSPAKHRHGAAKRQNASYEIARDHKKHYREHGFRVRSRCKSPRRSRGWIDCVRVLRAQRNRPPGELGDFRVVEPGRRLREWPTNQALEQNLAHGLSAFPPVLPHGPLPELDASVRTPRCRA